MLDYIVPLLLFGICVFALSKKEDPYRLMLAGAKDGLSLLFSLVPTMVLLMVSVTMLRTSGAMGMLEKLLSPAVRLLGIPAETVMLVLIRPISGSAALAVGSELMFTHGPDSLVGRTAAIMLGSTETTFYTISVYFGAANIRKTRYTLPAALFADLVGFVMASVTARLM